MRRILEQRDLVFGSQLPTEFANAVCMVSPAVELRHLSTPMANINLIRLAARTFGIANVGLFSLAGAVCAGDRRADCFSADGWTAQLIALLSLA